MGRSGEVVHDQTVLAVDCVLVRMKQHVTEHRSLGVCVFPAIDIGVPPDLGHCPRAVDTSIRRSMSARFTQMRLESPKRTDGR